MVSAKPQAANPKSQIPNQQISNPQSPIPNPSSRNPVFDQDEVRRMVKAGVERLDRNAVFRRRLGLVLRLGRVFLAAHHGPGGPRPLAGQAEQRGPGARRLGTRHRVAQTLPGRAGPSVEQRRDQGQAGRPAVEESMPTISTPSSTWCWSMPARRTPTCSSSSTATAPTWPFTAWPCTASPWNGRASKKNSP